MQSAPAAAPTSTENSSVDSGGGAGVPTIVRPAARGRSWHYAVIAVAIVVTLIVAAFVLTGGFHHSSPSTAPGLTLAPDGDQIAIAPAQLVGLTFSANSTVTLTGSYWTTYNVSAYIMTSADFSHYLRTLKATSYEWTSGYVKFGAISQVLDAGSWVLVFIAPTYHATQVGVTSTISVNPA